MPTMIDLDALPRCPDCGYPILQHSGMLVAPGGPKCLYCRAITAEGQLQQLSVWGDDEWMRKIASIAFDDSRPDKALSPIGFEIDLADCGKGPVRVITRPQTAFRPVLLTVDPVVAPYGTLVDAMVGNRSQTWSASAIPLTLFSPSHWTSLDAMREVAGRFEWDTVSVAQDIALIVDMTMASFDPLVEVARESQNMPTPTKFRAAVWGHVLDPNAPLVDSRVVTIAHGDVRALKDALDYHDLAVKVRSPSSRQG